MRKRICQGLLATTVLALSIAAVAAPSAMATPKGEFAVFAKCPLTNPNVEACLISKTESGEIKIGNTGVPIVNTQILQGGLHNLEPVGKEFIDAEHGETFPPTPQKVPGGLLDLVKCNEIKGEGLIEKGLRKLCESVFENGLTGVNATTELVGPVSLNEIYLEIGEGPALILPVRVKLENTLLGGECYIGSSKEPITLELTSGTSGKLTGYPGKIGTKAEGKILSITGNKLVEENFKAPAATGCGLFGLLDSTVNKKLELPASTGNTAVLNNSIEQANSEFVQESE
jgi:hypothetical protein